MERNEHKGASVMIRQALVTMTAVVALLAGPALCQNDSGRGGFVIGGHGAVEMGQIVKGYYNDGTGNWGNGGSPFLLHQWQERSLLTLRMQKALSPALVMNLGVELGYDYVSQHPAPMGLNYQGPYTHKASIKVDRLVLDCKIREGNAGLRLQTGYFPFKYNAAVCNLGEYLFRTTCYPNFIVNTFDFAYDSTRLLGLNLENTLFGIVRQNVLLTSETTFYPNRDFSLTYLAAARFFNGAIDIGGGVSGYHVLPVEKLRTTPRGDGSTPFSSIKNGDTIFYSFSGTKVMARVSIDPKPFFDLPFFGKQDLLLYAEGAILGLKNYPFDSNNAWLRYDVRSERMPITVGFHLPAFKLLDVLACEAEYHASRYNNNNKWVIDKQQPLPTLPEGLDLDASYAHRLKWSIYGSKTIGKNVRVAFQCARDHRRTVNGTDNPKILYGGDITYFPRDWYYMFKVQFGF